MSWTLPLTLSGNADSDIQAYLHGSFVMIRAKYSIPDSTAWPAEEDICRFVSQSAGLFVYAVTALRYIDGIGNGRSGLEERLCAVLQLDSMSTEIPFSALDQLYMLVMMQIPEGVLYDTMSLLYLGQSPTIDRFMRSLYERHFVELSRVTCICSLLGLSSAAFCVTISNLYSVLEVTMSESGGPEEFHFYHKSFLDFLLDSRRSKQYFIESPVVHQHCLEMIVRTLSTEVGTDASEYPKLWLHLSGG
jgi:hypothetical protein